MQWVGIRRSVSFDIREAKADPTGESTAGLAGPEESDAGEATIDRIASTAKFSDSVRAGKSSKEHQFDSGRIPPESQDRKLIFRT